MKRSRIITWKSIITVAISILALAAASISMMADLPTAIRNTLESGFDPFISAANEGEILIVIARFHHSDLVADTEIQNEIKRGILESAKELRLPVSVEVKQVILRADELERAKALGEKYKASAVIWGEDTGVRITVKFHEIGSLEVTEISEEDRSQYASRGEYQEFVTDDLPAELTSLSMLVIGSALLNKDRTEQAKTAFTAVLEHDPESITAYNLRGVVNLVQGNFGPAISDFNEVILLDAKADGAYSNRGVAQYRLGNVESAISDINESIRLEPAAPLPYLNLGNLNRDIGETEEAIDNYNRVMQLNPDFSAVALHNRGITYKTQENWDQAVADLSEAIRLDPENERSYHSRGDAYLIMEDWDHALADFNTAVTLNPDNYLNYHLRGAVYNAQGFEDQAIADYSDSIRLNPTFAQGYHDRGLIYIEQNDLEKALKDFNEAIRLDPNFDNYDHLGYIYARTGNLQKALENFSETIRLNPDYAPGYHDRGLIYLQMGRVLFAIKDLEKALQLYTRDGLPDANEVQAILNRIKHPQ